MKTAGFTLLEIVITLFILMIVGIMVSAGLGSIVKTEAHLKNKKTELATIQSALMQIDEDIQQMTLQPVLNAQGNELPIMSLGPNQVQFSRLPIINLPLAEYKPLVSKIMTYQLVGTDLYRISQSIVNKQIAGPPTRTLLLNHVLLFRCVLIPADSPLTKTKDELKRMLPTKTVLKLGIMFEIEVAKIGNIKRVIALPFNTLHEDPHAIF